MSETVKNTPVKKSLIAVIYLVMIAPALVGALKLVKEKPVEGAWITPSPPQLTAASVFSADFQKNYELWRNENIGFHYSLIRLKNQLNYSLFGTNVMSDAVIGKNDYLYLSGYVNAYTGKDFIGNTAILQMTQKIKALQDTLAAHHVTLLIVMAPGKASVYPEGVPDRYGVPSAITNHNVMRHDFDSAGINLIDFNSYFVKRRFTADYPIYSNTSVHWTDRAALEALDSIVHYIEFKRKIDMPDIFIDGEEWSDIPRGSDNDVGSALNLIFPVKTCRMAYPVYHYDTTGKTKITMMTVADSYIRMMMHVGMTKYLTSSHDYWYYNQGIEHSDSTPTTNVLDVNTADATMHHDVVMILSTELNYAGFSWGYIDDAYRSIVLKQPIDEKERQIRTIENHIRMDKAWLFQIQQKAYMEQVPLDTMIRRDAVYAADHSSGS